MAIPLFLGLLILLLPLSSEAARMMGKIIGGQKAMPHSRPYMAYLHIHEEDDIFLCDGFLIREDFVMTAAHCMGRSIEVSLGVHDTSKKPLQKIRVKHQISHPDFNTDDMENDIMLLKLSENATLCHDVTTIALPEGQDAKVPAQCSVSGWGRLLVNEPQRPHELREVKVTVSNSEKCPKEICVRGNMGPAQGDSGGPLVCDGVAHGVVSHFQIFEKDFLFVYTKISTYMPWIHKEMKK
ncbi:duodenase-1 [Megalops cyprinoides]|uniref:duodenase-1 n=1 Tax=Megalops cyprinoides TaxID=118141 RepID=UPI0018643CC5|nr:duodenase-1 [Megalops cyprinoides]